MHDSPARANCAWNEAQCLTSLDGVTFATSASSFTPLTLQNGWNGFPAVAASPAVRVISGIVHLKGVMYTNGTNPVAFTLPTGDPAHDVYVKVGLGDDAGNGQLFITPSGSVTVQAEGGNWTSAQAFTSLDGASFAR